jgi:uncharacterized protein (DUF305 family)
MTKALTFAAALIATATLALSGCGDDSADRPGGTVATASNGDTFNDADVAFATDMIQHHAQALQMVDIARGRSLDPEVEQLLDDIQAAQGPEIEQMTDWLTAWDKPIPATVRDHTNADGGMGGMDMGQDMPGMITADQIDELTNAADADFQTLWLTRMIEHHRGAIEMARSHQTDGEHPEALALAEQVEADQQAQITTMEQMLAP